MQVSKGGYSNPYESDEVERLRREVQLLENLVQELRVELKNKRPMTAHGNGDWEDEKIEMEVRLQKAQARIDAMQNEMTSSAALFAKEISKLKLIIAVSQFTHLIFIIRRKNH